jgi:hypothetical protein
MMRSLAPVVTVVTVVTLAGCAGSEAGTPTPVTPSDRSTAPTSADDRPRPRSVDLTGKDACAALSEQQRPRWGIDRPPTAGTLDGGSVLDGSRACAFGSFADQVSITIVLSTEIGLGEYLEKTEADPSRQELTVGGFPAASAEGKLSAPEIGSGACFVDVDVADDQLMSVQFSQLAASQEKRLPVDTLCAKASEVAEAALTTLQGG